MEDEFGSTNSYYVGRLLTIIDASMPGEQGRAIKDLVKNEMYEYLQDAFSDCHKVVHKLIEQHNVDVKIARQMEEGSDITPIIGDLVPPEEVEELKKKSPSFGGFVEETQEELKTRLEHLNTK